MIAESRDERARQSEFVEVSKVKKKATIVIVTICVLVVIIGITLSAFRSSEVYRKKKASIMWDCSVTCMEASTSEKYVINYADSKVISKTGALTIQNRNDLIL